MSPWHPLPAAIHSLVEERPGTVLLESARPGPASDSRLFTNPIRVIQVREFAELPALFAQIEDAISRGLFAAGYFGYECGQHFEPTANLRPRPDNNLLAWFGIYEHCHVFDHAAGAFLDRVPCRIPDELAAQPGLYQGSTSVVPQMPESRSGALAPEVNGSVQFALDERQYARRIAEIHEWIRAGNVYQLNFTFPLRAQVNVRPAALYGRLRAAQPVDYAAFLHCQSGRHILSLSPELFFRVDQRGTARRISTQPMKGTARRGRTTAEDRDISAWLRNDPKNLAENVMIVDLIRNDLGRLCSYGSIRVEKLFAVERYPTLWQMTSTVSGELQPGIGYEQIFRALFPCGSVTGAPKVRAMQLLAQIENRPRGIYTGAIGYFSRERSIFNVAIRTLALEDSNATMGIGGGIVIDSDPATEYRECHLKAEFLTRPTEHFSLIETMLWKGSFPLLELHLDRLADSADYFAFPCERAAVKDVLLAEAAAFLDQNPRRVRLLLDSNGSLHIESELLIDLIDKSAETLSVCISSQRTDPADRFLFHKTTHRVLYNSVFASASTAGFADILFLNTRDEVTEGAISNLFIEKDGRWYTPPLDCGVLPGIYRRHLLATRPDIEEKRLSLNDLKRADSVYLANAVRGLRKVTVDFNPIVDL